MERSILSQESGDIDSLLAQLTLDEKISLLAGANVWETVPIERLSIPSLRVGTLINPVLRNTLTIGPRLRTGQMEPVEVSSLMGRRLPVSQHVSQLLPLSTGN